MKIAVVAVCCAFILSACDRLSIGGKFEMTLSTNGEFYLLNKTSGEVWVLEGGTLSAIERSDFQLKKGRKYSGADGYFFTYAGKGEFKDVSSLKDYFIEKADLERVPPVPEVGQVVEGYIYKGGDPAREGNWEKKE